MAAHARCREKGCWWVGAFPDGLDALAAWREHYTTEHERQGEVARWPSRNV